MRHVFVILVVASCLALEEGRARLDAQQIGDRVVVVRDQVALRAGDETIDVCGRGDFFTVFNVKVDWLLVGRGRAGWVSKDTVLSADAARAVFERMLVQKPSDAGAHAALASIFVERRQPAGAQPHLNEALRLNPQSVQSWLIASELALLGRDYPRAVAHAGQAIRLAPRSPLGYQAVGRSWCEARQFDRANADLTAAVECDRRNCRSRYYRALARLSSPRKADVELAINDFNDAESLATDDPWVRRRAILGRGLAWEKQGDSKRAMDEYALLLRENRDDTSALIARGSAFAREKNFEQAMSDLDLAVSLAPKEPAVLLARAAARTRQYNFRGAQKDLDQALQLSPAGDEAYLVRGDLLVRQHKWADAVVAFTKAIELNPQSAWAFQRRGETYAKLKKEAEATADARQAAALEPQLAGPTSPRTATSGTPLTASLEQFLKVER